MAKPFHETGFSKQEEKAIHKTLKEAKLKRGADWKRRILPDIITVMTDLHEGDSVPGRVAYVPTKTRQLKALITALDDAKRAYEQLGERYHWHLDDQVGCGNRLGLSDVLNVALPAARLAAEKPNPHVHLQETGRRANRAMKLAVSALLEIFENATGIEPIVAYSPYAPDRYHEDGGHKGKFYEFAVACLTPVGFVDEKHLGSAIYAEYKIWNRVLRASDLDEGEDTIVTIRSFKQNDLGTWVLRFNELEGRLPLDVSDVGSICGLYGDDIDEWIGEKIAITGDQSGIRVQPRAY